jgi:hypothetical protein
MVGFDIGFEQKDKHSSEMNMWFNPESMLKYTPTAKTAITIRAEYYNDRHGVIIPSSTPNGFKTFGFSTNLDYKITNNLLWRVKRERSIAKTASLSGMMVALRVIAYL